MQHTRWVLAVAIGAAIVAGTGDALRAQASSPGITTSQSTAAPVQPAPAPQPMATATPAGETFEKLTLTAGRSMVLPSAFDITRLAVTNPAVADATAVAPREVLIDGKAAGTISLILWGTGGARKQYDVVVDAGVPILQQQLAALFPGEDIRVAVNDEALVLSGSVSSNSVMLRAAELAAASSGKYKIINMLQLPGGSESQQVMLQVRFAEVSRRALMELGVSLFTSPGGVNNTLARTTTQQFAAPGFSNLEWTKTGPGFGADVASSKGEFTFGDFLNLFLFNQKYDIGAMIRALKGKGLFQSLAEPNLIAYNGQEASFLAGGEVPVPVVQGVSNTVTVQYKEYGVRLNFRPTVAGDTIRLHVRPEVSTLDFPNGVVLQGFRIPALATRRAETEVELRDGQSFAIAGLLNNLSQDDANEVPGLARLPIIGHLFKSKSERAEQTELMVIITPQLVRPLNPDEVPPLPTLQRRFLPRGGDLGDQIQGGGGVADAPDPSTKR
jgi:pilus assembly protein CpaC